MNRMAKTLRTQGTPHLDALPFRRGEDGSAVPVRAATPAVDLAESFLSPMYVFSLLAAPVAQTCSLLYRRFLTCQPLLASNALPITNRRYGRLKICATLNTYSPIGGEDQGEGATRPTHASSERKRARK